MEPAQRTPLITERDITRRVQEMAASILQDYSGDDLCLVGLLKGSFIFMADLSRELSCLGMTLLTDFMTVSSYGDALRSSGRVNIVQDISLDIQGRDVLVIDDILDSGLTLQAVRAHLQEKGAATIRTCVLLARKRPGLNMPAPEYTGFHIGTGFVVGYGLDLAGRYRELPGIYTISGTSARERT